MQLRTAGGGSSGDGQPPIAVHSCVARLVQLVIHGEEAVVHQRHLILWNDVVLNVAKAGDRATGPRHVIGEGIGARRGVGDDLGLLAGGQRADRGRVEPSQIRADQLVPLDASGDRGR